MNRKEIVEEIHNAIQDGPTFNQSNLQNVEFVVNKHNMPARQYRQVLLELNNKLVALQKAEIAVKRTKAKMAILKKEFENEFDGHKKTIIECDIEDKEIDLAQNTKLVKDAIHDCNVLYAVFKKMPKITHEDFEKQEPEYWEKRLLLDAELSVLATGRVDIGTALSLTQLGLNPLKVQTEIALAQHQTALKIEGEQKNLLGEKGK